MDYIDHHFRVDLAQKFGIDTAVFLHDVYYWVKHNKLNQKNFFEGRYWTYNTMTAFCENHPYWSRRQIERIITSCKDNGLLLVGCFNKDARDRTKWYTLTDKAMRFFCDDVPAVPPDIPPPEAPPPDPQSPDLADCISPNGEMQITEPGNTFHQTVTALPDNIPYSTHTDIPPNPPKGTGGRKKSMPKWQPEWFERFWAKYPPRLGVKDGRKEAIKAWDKLKPDLELCNVMSKALDPVNWPKRWHDDNGRYIPMPSTWLNNDRWELEHVQQPAAQTPSQAESQNFGWGCDGW